MRSKIKLAALCTIEGITQQIQTGTRMSCCTGDAVGMHSKIFKNGDVMYRGGDNGTVGTVQEEALLVLVWHA